MSSDSPSPPAKPSRSPITKGKAFGSQTKKLVKRAGGSSTEISAAIPPSTKRKTPQGQKLAGKRLLLDNKDLVNPVEAM
jgi:hypothetical protein